MKALIANNKYDASSWKVRHSDEDWADWEVVTQPEQLRGVELDDYRWTDNARYNAQATEFQQMINIAEEERELDNEPARPPMMCPQLVYADLSRPPLHITFECTRPLGHLGEHKYSLALYVDDGVLSVFTMNPTGESNRQYVRTKTLSDRVLRDLPPDVFDAILPIPGMVP